MRYKGLVLMRWVFLGVFLSLVVAFVVYETTDIGGPVPTETAQASDEGQKPPIEWTIEFPKADFTKYSVDFGEIASGGPPRDGIPALTDPPFVAAGAIGGIRPEEPVMSVILNGEAKAYPLRILIWHEIVNDTVGGTPVAVTFCPLCNSGIVFDRRLGDKVVELGVSGRLRNSDMLMYDQETESWWQQFTGEAVIGTLTGERLSMIPARQESYQAFIERTTEAKVMIPPDPGQRKYGRNPYIGYDTSDEPFLFKGALPTDIAPLERVVAIGEKAWAFSYLQQKGEVRDGDLVLTWTPGMTSVLDAPLIEQGRDIGQVVVQRAGPDGTLEDVAHDLAFAFAFRAFFPDGVIVKADP